MCCGVSGGRRSAKISAPEVRSCNSDVGDSNLHKTIVNSGSGGSSRA